jgi:hypothetical protein
MILADFRLWRSRFGCLLCALHLYVPCCFPASSCFAFKQLLSCKHQQVQLVCGAQQVPSPYLLGTILNITVGPLFCLFACGVLLLSWAGFSAGRAAEVWRAAASVDTMRSAAAARVAAAVWGLSAVEFKCCHI